MANIPIINPPEQDCDGWCWHHQFTIPLLFDDCLSLLQKVCALWAKLNDVIDALNVFNDEFNTWASEVERQLADLYNKYNSLDARVAKCENDIKNINQTLENIQNRLSNIENNINNINQQLTNLDNRLATVENTISNINQSIQNINQSISKITNDLLDLEERVENLENLLENLNIIPPIDVYNETDNSFESGLWVNWWNWLKDKVVFPSSVPASGWEYSANVVQWDTTTHLPRYFQLGRLAQPTTLCKLPFVAVYKNAFSSKPTLSQLASSAPYYKDDAFTAGNGFFDFNLTKAFGYTMDEVKFQTSYIPFLPVDSIMFTSWGSGSIGICKNINCGVRVQVPSTGTKAKLCVATNQLVLAACPSSVPVTASTKWDLYIYAVAENG